MYQIQKYTTVNHLGRILHLLHEHGMEVTGKATNGDIGAIVRMFDMKMLTLYTLEYNAFAVGYSLFLRSCDMWFAHVLRGEELGIYVQPAHRGKWSLRLIRYAEEDLIASGYKRLIRTANIGSPFSHALEKLGYDALQQTYFKEVH